MKMTALNLRLYEPGDIPRALDLLCAALPQLPNYSMIVPDRGRIEYVLTHNIDNAESFAGWVLCDSHNVVQGFSGGWCVRSLMSYDLIADDIFCWIEPEYRSYDNARKLIQAYVEWAVAKGAKLIRASHTGGSFPKGSREAELFDALLRRQGFKEVGSIYHLSKYGDT
jgi:GNAT superfamily N-acetyltransferase